MAGSSVRRPVAGLPVALLAGGAFVLHSLSGRAFVPSAATGPARAARGRTAVRGFKEDFEAWRASLTPEERDLTLKQARLEFNKQFRKSEEFQQDLPAEKAQAFSSILEKFFQAESDDLQKAGDDRTPDYDALARKSREKKMEFDLKGKVVEINRDADRRYHFASMKIKEAQDKGEFYPQASPAQEQWALRNNDAESHEVNLKVVEFMKKRLEDPECAPELKPYLEAWVEKGVPAMGENFFLRLPTVLVNQIQHMRLFIQKKLSEQMPNATKEEILEFKQSSGLLDDYQKAIQAIAKKYVAARDEVEEEVEQMKEWFGSQRDLPGKTKADLLKELWEELPSITDQTLPPLDEEMLAELAKEPATIPEEFKHSWGTASKLYKSEAIDAFGQKYLLGIFETKEEASKAFASWNAEYEQARAEMKEEMSQWAKQEQARLDKDSAGQERIKKVLEEARR